MKGERWTPAPHLLLLNEHLLALAARRITRLIVTMPPRYGKSELISQFFPAWYLGRFPHHRVIHTSYDASLSHGWGGKARDTLAEVGGLFGVRLDGGRTARADWGLRGYDGGMVCAGVGGPITGKGADLLIVDDPLKNLQEALAPTIRGHLWEWWQSTAYTRLQRQGVACIVMTRWHEDDLVGRLLADMEQGGERWTVLNLPARAEAPDDPLGRPPGAPLWPALHDAAALTRIERAVGAYVWAAEYQQRPSPPGGAFFQRSWFKLVDAAPAGLRRVRYWDFAGTEALAGRDPDWTVGTAMGERDGGFWLTDVARLRGTPQAVEQAVQQAAALDGHAVPIWLEQEPGSSGVAFVDHYRRRVLRGYVVHAERPTGAKDVRARPFASAAEAGNVRLVRGPWNKTWLDEVETFPLGTHDDQVDSASGAHRALTQPRRRVGAY